MLALIAAATLVAQADPDGSPDAMTVLDSSDDVCALIVASVDEPATCRRIEQRRIAGVGTVALYRARDAYQTRYVIVATDDDGTRRASLPLDVGFEPKLCAGGEEPLRQHLRLRRVVVDGVRSVALEVRFAVRENIVDGAYCKVRGHDVWHDEVILVVGANGESLELAPGLFQRQPARLSRTLHW
jgi:hypothetical protein